MSSELYVALSAQMAMEERLMTVANNVANMRTAGFRAETVNFDTVLSAHAKDRVAFAAVGPMTIDRSPGAMELTGNDLDLAIAGDAWFAIETPAGVAYTRDGRLSIDGVGDVRTLTGYPVLDDGLAPLAVDPAGGPPNVANDGSITQNGAAIGNIGLFQLPASAELTRFGDTALMSDIEGLPVEDRAAIGVRQGYREGSNVNPVQALTELITVQRNFEHANTVTRDRQSSLEAAVRTLGAE